jgi:exodeoxyribonuclease VII large subunit
VPIISAVGHETDFSLCDFAADCRAETPSAAAELISSAHLEQIESVATLATALHNVMADTLRQRRADLAFYAHRWQAVSPRQLIEQAYLQLDDCAGRMQLQMREAIHERRNALHHAAAALAALSPTVRLPVERARLEGLEQRLTAAGVERVLARGFVMLADTAGKPLTRHAQLSKGQKVRARFADGDAGLTAD